MRSLENTDSIATGGPVHRVRFHPRLPWLVGVCAERDRVYAWRFDGRGRDASAISLLTEDAKAPGHFPSHVSFHPTRGLLAVAAGDRPIQLWDVAGASLVTTLGTASVSEYEAILRRYGLIEGEGPASEGSGANESDDDIPSPHEDDDEWPVDKAVRGYHNVSFSPTGALLIAGAISDSRWASTEVYDPTTAELVGLFENNNGDIALHPEGEILATASMEQGGDAIRFVQLTETFQCYELSFNVFCMENIHGMTFSPAGDALALAGIGLPERGRGWEPQVLVYDFPSCRRRFKLDIEMPRPLPIRAGDYLPYLIDRAVFSPDGTRLICPWPTGHLVELDSQTGRELRRWEAHDGAATTVDIRYDLGLLASGGADGVIRLWQYDEMALLPASEGKPVTAAFLKSTRPVGPFD